MPGMKVTVDAAMRARDVSRPHAEHEALAAARLPEPSRTREQNQSPPAAAPGPAAPGAAGAPSKGRPPRRRRRRR